MIARVSVFRFLGYDLIMQLVFASYDVNCAMHMNCHMT